MKKTKTISPWETKEIPDERRVKALALALNYNEKDIEAVGLNGNDIVHHSTGDLYNVYTKKEVVATCIQNNLEDSLKIAGDGVQHTQYVGFTEFFIYKQ